MTFTLNLTDIEIELGYGDVIHLGKPYGNRPTRIKLAELAVEVDEGALPAELVSRARFEQLGQECKALFDLHFLAAQERNDAIVDRDDWALIAKERGEALAEWINTNAWQAGIIAQLRTQLELVQQELAATTDELERVLDDVCTANPDEPVEVDIVLFNGSLVRKAAA